jgi:hypothetical protein
VAYSVISLLYFFLPLKNVKVNRFQAIQTTGDRLNFACWLYFSQSSSLVLKDIQHLFIFEPVMEINGIRKFLSICIPQMPEECLHLRVFLCFQHNTLMWPLV